jgi:hypothetical protein
VPLALATDATANIYFAGGTMSQLDSEPIDGGADVFLLKFDRYGTVLWDRTFGPGSDQWANAVALDCSGNVYLAGAFIQTLEMDATPPLMAAAGDPGDAFVAQLDPNGDAVWSRAFGDAGVQAVTSLAVDGGDIVLGALLIDDVGSMGVSFGGALHGPSGVDETTYHEDFAIAKLGPDATFRWSYRFGDLYLQRGEVAAGEAGFVAAGDFYESIKFDDTVDGTLESPTLGQDFFVAAFNH